MSRLATSFVLGYHGCDRAVAEQAVAGDIQLLYSDRPFDWLGPGAYFWESDPQRAEEWAKSRAKNGAYDDPCVVGAVIDLRNCLDLLNRPDQDLLAVAYESLAHIHEKAGLPLPKNKNSKRDSDNDRRLRYLDCAVITHLHELADQFGGEDIAPFDTVRGMFTEGEEIYPGSAFMGQSHVQLAVRNNDCIKGVFFPPEMKAVD